MIGPPENRNADPTAWTRLEAELETELPRDREHTRVSHGPYRGM